MNYLSKFLLITIIFFSSTLYAEESESTAIGAGIFGYSKKDTYSSTKQEYDNNVREKLQSLRNNDSSSMVNEANQPTKKTSESYSVGPKVGGIGVQQTYTGQDTNTSASEEALKGYEYEQNIKNDNTYDKQTSGNSSQPQSNYSTQDNSSQPQSDYNYQDNTSQSQSNYSTQDNTSQSQSNYSTQDNTSQSQSNYSTQDNTSQSQSNYSPPEHVTDSCRDCEQK